MKSDKKALDSKPVKRTKTSSAVTPKAASHRHSKVSMPPTPVEEVTVSAVAPAPKPVAAAPAPVASPAPAPVAAAAPAPEEVAQLAHAFWVERNFAHGFAEEDWFRAEKALSATN